MEFSLQKYITEKYLLEKLQSDTLINELMNDKGGMFRYYKMQYKWTIYDKVIQISDKMQKIIKSLFNPFGYMGEIQRKEPKYNDELIDTDEKTIALHKTYMNLYNKYIDLVSNKLFMKPDPQILSTLTGGIEYDGGFINKTVDLYNITDEHFEKHTLKEIKSDKNLKQEIINNYIQVDGFINNLIFWISSEHEILAVSLGTHILLYSLLNNIIEKKSDGKRFLGKDINEIINATNKENLTVNTLTFRLNNGPELKFPTVQRMSFISDKRELVGIDYIKKTLLDLHEDNRDYSGNNINKVGVFTSKASQLYKTTHWGDSIDDYIIIYKPEQVFDNGKIKSTYTNHYGDHIPFGGNYNDHKISRNFSEHKNKRLNDFNDIQQQTYKWEKDILGKFKPYAGGKDYELFDYGKKLSNYEYDRLYGTDEYCSKLAKSNFDRYKTLAEQQRTIIGMTEFTNKLKEVLPNLTQFVKDGKIFCGRIKSTINKDKDMFKSLISLYGIYTKLVNTALSHYGRIQASIINFKKKYSTDKIKSLLNADSYQKQYMQRDIKNTRNEISRYIDKLVSVNNEITEFHNKILEILNS